MTVTADLNMLVLIFLFAGACAALAAPAEKQIFDLDEEAQLVQLFDDFKQEYKKNYDLLEHSKRYKIFVDNLAKINELNKQDSTAFYGINKFTDMTMEEFRATRTGVLPEHDVSPSDIVNVPDIEIPKQFDWRDHNVVTSVKDQGNCSSCWAFSIAGTIEGQYAMKYKELVDLSPQEMVSCDLRSMGCIGAPSMKRAMRSLVNLGGLETEKDYPYYSGQDGNWGICDFDKSKVKVTVTSYKAFEFSSMSEDQVAQLLVATGPLSIGLFATNLSSYKGGIINEQCMNYDLEDWAHAVVLVGYGEDNGVPYWLIKNSWGKDHGEHGYFRMKRGVNCLGFLKMPGMTGIVA